MKAAKILNLKRSVKFPLEIFLFGHILAIAIRVTSGRGRQPI